MMHLTFSDKSLLVGDRVGELTIEYAAALARSGGADTVKLTAYGADGDKVEATLLLDQGTPLMGESTHSDLPEPDNGEVAAYIMERLADIASPPAASPIDGNDSTISQFEKQFDTDTADGDIL